MARDAGPDPGYHRATPGPKCLPTGPWESPESRDDRPACAPRSRTGRDESRPRGRRTRGGRAGQPGSRSGAGRSGRRGRPHRHARPIAWNLRCAGRERAGVQPRDARAIVALVVSSATGQSGARRPIAIGRVDGGRHAARAAGYVAARIGSDTWWQRAASGWSDTCPGHSGRWADAKAHTKAHDTTHGSPDARTHAPAGGEPAPAPVPRQRDGASRARQGGESESAMRPPEPAATAPAEQRRKRQHIQRMGMAHRLCGARRRRRRVRPGNPPDSIPPEDRPDERPGGTSPEASDIGSDIGRRASLGGGEAGPPINNHLPEWSP
jgi:hypothetical protein